MRHGRDRLHRRARGADARRAGDEVRVTYRDAARLAPARRDGRGAGQGRRARPARAAAGLARLRDRLPQRRASWPRGPPSAVWQRERGRAADRGRGRRGRGRAARGGHLERRRRSARRRRARRRPRTTSTAAAGRAGLHGLQARGRAGGARRRGAAGRRGGGRQPVVRARAAGRPRRSPARPRRGSSATTCAAGCRRSSTRDTNIVDVRGRGAGPPAGRRAGQAGRALHPRRRTTCAGSS